MSLLHTRFGGLNSGKTLYCFQTFPKHAIYGGGVESSRTEFRPPKLLRFSAESLRELRKPRLVWLLGELHSANNTRLGSQGSVTLASMASC